MTWERFFLSWLTQSTFPPLLWHGSLLWVGTSVWAWKVAFGPEYRVDDRVWVEGTSLQLKVTSQPPLHTWGSDAQRRLHSSDFARHEWEWKVRASYPICRSPLPPHSPHHRPVLWFTPFFSSYFASTWSALMESEQWLLCLFIYVFILRGWALIPIYIPPSQFLPPSHFFKSTFPQLHWSPLTQSWLGGTCEFIVSDILAKKENLWWWGHKKRESLRTDGDGAFPDVK